MSGIVTMSAVALARAIRTKELSCADVMAAVLKRIHAVNPAVNALVALRDPDALMREARAKDEALARGEYHGLLHGFPLAVKDLDAVKGLPFTQGSPLFANRIAEADSIMAARMRAAGAVFTGKSNTPEFGLGSHTFNPVYGATGNAYDPSRSAGGSSGGAAVSVAFGMQPVADGSDHAGSLRNPPAFNNLFGLRSAYGRIPAEAKDVFTPNLGVAGAIGRSPADIALLMAVMSGYDARVPYSIRQDPALFLNDLARDFKGTRIAYLGDFGGRIPFEPGVLEVCRSALKTFEDIGCVVEEVLPDHDIEQVWQDWLILRAFLVASALKPLYDNPQHRAQLKPEAQWEAERGLSLSVDRLIAAQEGRTQWYQAVSRLMERYDFLVLPSAQVFPFDKTIRWPESINGVTMDTYHRWMQIVIPVTMSGLPALNVPAGFGANGLPTGLQIVAKNHDEFACLQLGAAYDAASGWVSRRPPPLPV